MSGAFRVVFKPTTPHKFEASPQTDVTFSLLQQTLEDKPGNFAGKLKNDCPKVGSYMYGSRTCTIGPICVQV